MSLRFQRLSIILLSLIFIASAILLILKNSKKNLTFFYTPTELSRSNIQIGNTVRIGGFVKEESIITNKNNNHKFIVTDNISKLNVSYQGMLPDLFKEGQGTVIEGILIKKNYVEASTVFAKHDENYIPATLSDELKKNEYWKKDYK